MAALSLSLVLCVYVVQACLRYGEFHHQVESRLSLRLLGHQAKRVKAMAEEDAVQLGATMISEAFIFATAGGLLWWELSRKGREDAKAKEEKERKEREREERMEERFREVVAMVAKEHEERERMREEMEEMRSKLAKRWL